MKITEEQPLVSIIIPVYNAEKYLEECLNSIMGQTYSNLEILLIDDGSKDRSGEKCDQYAKKDNRIKVYHKSNSGVSKTRNYGLDHCTGEWIAFVDSDDYIEKDYIEHFLRQNVNSFNVGGYNLFGWNVSGIKRHVGKKERYYNLNNDISKIDVTPSSIEINIIYHICSKLYNNKILQANHIRFPENMILAEDCCFNIEYLRYCPNVAMIPYSGYYYRRSHQEPVYKMNLRQYQTHCTILEKCFKDLSSTYKGYEFTNISTSLYKSFLSSLKDGLIDKEMNFNKLKEECKINRVDRILTIENLAYAKPVYRIAMCLIYSYPLIGIILISIQRRIRQFKK